MTDIVHPHPHYCVTVSLQHVLVLVPSLGQLLGDGAVAASELSVPVENMKATRYHSCSQALLSYSVHVQNNLSEMIILEYIPVVMSSLSRRMEDGCSASNGVSEQAMRVTV